MEVPCVNCKREFDPEKGQWWEKLFLCADCCRTAERIHERGEKRLRWMLTILKAAIKDALLEGRLQLGPSGEPPDEGDFLLKLKQLADQTRASNTKKEADASPKHDD